MFDIDLKIMCESCCHKSVCMYLKALDDENFGNELPYPFYMNTEKLVVRYWCEFYETNLADEAETLIEQNLTPQDIWANYRYNKGDMTTRDGVMYISLRSDNIFTPTNLKGRWGILKKGKIIE